MRHPPAGPNLPLLRPLKRNAPDRPIDGDEIEAVEAVIGNIGRLAAESGGPFPVGGFEDAGFNTREPVAVGSVGRGRGLRVPHPIGDLDRSGVPLTDDAFRGLADEDASEAIGSFQDELAVARLPAEIGWI